MLLVGHSAESVATRLGLKGAQCLYRWNKELLTHSGPIGTLASPAITLTTNDATINKRFDFDLFAVIGLSQAFQRQSAAITDFGCFRHVDLLDSSAEIPGRSNMDFLFLGIALRLADPK